MHYTKEEIEKMLTDFALDIRKDCNIMVSESDMKLYVGNYLRELNQRSK